MIANPAGGLTADVKIRSIKPRSFSGNGTRVSAAS